MQVSFRESEVQRNVIHESRARSAVVRALPLADVMEERSHEQQIRTVHITRARGRMGCCLHLMSVNGVDVDRVALWKRANAVPVR